MYNILSSAYAETTCVDVCMAIPMCPALFLIVSNSGSKSRINNSGDSGQPCLVPRATAYSFEMCVPVRALAVGLVIITMGYRFLFSRAQRAVGRHSSTPVHIHQTKLPTR